VKREKQIQQPSQLHTYRQSIRHHIFLLKHQMWCKIKTSEVGTWNCNTTTFAFSCLWICATNQLTYNWSNSSRDIMHHAARSVILHRS